MIRRSLSWRVWSDREHGVRQLPIDQIYGIEKLRRLQIAIFFRRSQDMIAAPARLNASRRRPAVSYLAHKLPRGGAQRSRAVPAGGPSPDLSPYLVHRGDESAKVIVLQ